MPHTPISDEMTKALDDVFYEIEQLVFTAIVSTSDDGLNNAVVESRLLHVRGLLDFFEHTSREKDNVLASDYGFPVSPLPVTHVYRERLNKDLAHLTYSRTRRTDAERLWPHEHVVHPLLEQCCAFAEHVLSTRSAYATKTAEHWKTLLAVISKAT